MISLLTVTNLFAASTDRATTGQNKFETGARGQKVDLRSWRATGLISLEGAQANAQPLVAMDTGDFATAAARLDDAATHWEGFERGRERWARARAAQTWAQAGDTAKAAERLATVAADAAAAQMGPVVARCDRAAIAVDGARFVCIYGRRLPRIEPDHGHKCT